MKLYDYKVQVLNYVLPYFRQNTDIKNILVAIGERFNGFQDVIVYMLDSLTIGKAQGVFLNNIGAEVGTTRDEVDYSSYFCVNLPHINVSKRFYFLSSGVDPNQKVTLEDAEFIQKIMAVIGSNISGGTRNENLQLIKLITNADSVIIEKESTCELSVHLYGENITYTNNTLKYIQNILVDGVNLKEVKIND